MIQYWSRTLKERKLKQIRGFKTGCWIDVHAPTEEEINDLAKKFHLDPGHLQDALDPNEVPRIEREDDTLYLFLRVPWFKDEKLSTYPLLFILAPKFFCTISATDFSFLDRLGKHPEFFTTQKIKCLILIYMDILKNFQSSCNTVGRNFGSVRNKADDIRNKDILNLISYEQILNDLLGAIVPMNASLESLLSGKVFKLFDEDHDLVEDLFLASGQIILLANNRLVNIRNTREAYTTIMTNNLNRVMKLFTSLTVLLTLPTIVFSFYGMNVSLPLDHNPIAYLLIGGITGIFVASLIFVFAKQDWL